MPKQSKQPIQNNTNESFATHFSKTYITPLTKTKSTKVTLTELRAMLGNKGDANA